MAVAVVATVVMPATAVVVQAVMVVATALVTVATTAAGAAATVVATVVAVRAAVKVVVAHTVPSRRPSGKIGHLVQAPHHAPQQRHDGAHQSIARYREGPDRRWRYVGATTARPCRIGWHADSIAHPDLVLVEVALAAISPTVQGDTADERTWGDAHRQPWIRAGLTETEVPAVPRVFAVVNAHGSGEVTAREAFGAERRAHGRIVSWKCVTYWRSHRRKRTLDIAA
eukprot:6284840-Prymnesium_polylepis.1